MEKQSIIKQISSLFLIVLATMSLTGCITFLTEIKVRGDGSGTVVQTVTINPEQMKETTENVAKQMGVTMNESKEDSGEDSSEKSDKKAFGEDDLKNRAEDLGPGVTFVSVEEIDTKKAAGIRVTYAFKDLNQLAINPKPEAAMGTAPAGSSSRDALKFRFNRKPNGNAVVTIVLAEHEPEGTNEQAANPPVSPSSSEELDEQTAMIEQMFKGLRLGMVIDVDGKVVKTNSQYVEGSKVTLMDIDFDSLLSDKEVLMALNAQMEKTNGDEQKMMDALKGIKGIKITTDREISIEFVPNESPVK